MLGVRSEDEFLDGRELESVESDELYDDRWSDMAGLGEEGTRVADDASDDNALVSSVSVEPLASFLLDWLPKRRSDFQPAELVLGECGEITEGACSLWINVCESLWPLTWSAAGGMSD